MEQYKHQIDRREGNNNEWSIVLNMTEFTDFYASHPDHAPDTITVRISLKPDTDPLQIDSWNAVFEPSGNELCNGFLETVTSQEGDDFLLEITGSVGDDSGGEEYHGTFVVSSDGHIKKATTTLRFRNAGDGYDATYQSA